MGNKHRASDGKYRALPKQHIKCKNCGEVFVVSYGQRSRKYCSHKCSTEHTANTGKRRVRESKACEYCGKLFFDRPSRIKKKKFCSYECSVEAKKNRIYRQCSTCGKEFYTTPSTTNIGKGKYCSHECWAKNRTIKGTTVVICERCGVTFTTHMYATEKGHGKYCSRQCQNEAIAEGLKKRIEKECPVCGRIFEARNWAIQNGYGIYCSKKCSSIAITGEKNYNWQGGISFEPYCPKFNKMFKERVRDYFNRKCVTCGKTETENKRKLSVHHVFHNKEACCDDSLPYFVTLCASCHGRVHGKGELFQAYFENLINNKYGGECYYTKEEWIEIDFSH